MSFNGGTVLFKDRDITEERIQDALITILTHPKTTISTLLLNNKDSTQNTNQEWVIVFKVDVPTELGKKYFMDINKTIKQPTVLVIKLLTNANQRELTNELTIHETLGPQSNILPFCPSFIFREEIKSKDTHMTALGNAFYGLLQTNYRITDSLGGEQELMKNIYEFIDTLRFVDLNILDIIKQKKVYSDIIGSWLSLNDLDKTTKKKIIALISKIYKLIQGFSVQTIIIMEFLECSSLRQFYKDKRSEKQKLRETDVPPTPYDLYNITLESLNLDELYNFCTYFLASLMAKTDYSHGDLHHDNVMICNTTETSIVPYLIDFGKSTALSNLQFHELNDVGEISAMYYFDLQNFNLPYNNSMLIKQFISPIYYLAKSKYKDRSDDLYKDIAAKIDKGEYVEAVILISMCKDKSSGHPSMFYETFNPSFYKDNEPVSINYLYLYKITKQQAEKYNALIRQIISQRETQQQTLDGEIRRAQSVISESGLESSIYDIQEGKSTRSIFDLFRSKISPASRTRDSIPPNTSNSIPPTRVVGGRYILNFIKNKSKKGIKSKNRNTKKSRKITTKKRRNRTKK